MTRPGGRAENQHYVPKILLRHFAIDPEAKEPQLHVFDKRSGNRFLTGISNIAVERAFYDLKDGDSAASFEPMMTELEGHANTALQKIRSARRVGVFGPGGVLRPADILWLATFVAAQRIRVRAFREAMLQLDRDMAALAADRGADPAKVAGQRVTTEEDAKLATLAMLATAGKRFAELVARLDWFLFTTTSEAPFWISDNPLTMHDSADKSIFGGTEFAARGVEIYLPIGPTAILALWCPTLGKAVHEGVESGRRVLRLETATSGFRDTLSASIESAHLQQSVEERLSRLEPLLVAIRNGGSVQCTPEKLDFFNSAQVRFAERFVMATSPDFLLAERILREAPEGRLGGPRLNVK